MQTRARRGSTARAGRFAGSRHAPLMRAMVKATLLIPCVLCASAVAAQSPSDTLTVTAGEHYSAGMLHRFLFGSGYRALWTMPLRVPVLDLGSYAGGLTPTERGGGMQTRSLRFRGADGREYAFRSVDKDPSSILPPDLRETLVDDIVQDQISAAHPAGALVAAPLLDAVGVLHPEPRLYVMPDDPALGEFRSDFAGTLGMIEVRPNEGDGDVPGFAGATLVIATDRLLERMEEDVERIDARAFLSARLLDAFLGDWDRHRDQWRWARFGESPDSPWHPIPRDRDQAFVRLDGVLLDIARQSFPQLVEFGEDYPSTLGLTWNGRELDRRLLVGLEWPAWDSAAAALQTALTDTVIDRAVDALPSEYDRASGTALRDALRSRRDLLRDFARDFYELLAGTVEVHTTDAAETADLTRVSSDELRVVVTARTDRGTVRVYERTLHADETDEFRLALHGGADTARVSGAGGGGITIRVLGGGGDDVLIDDAGHARFYDTSGDNIFERASGTRIDERPHEHRGPAYPPSQPPRDWGTQYRFPLFAGYASDVGALIGISAERYAFGFRTWPYRSRLRLRVAFGAAAAAFRAEADAEVYRRNSGTRWTLSARGSGLEILRFYGFGNETTDEGEDDRYRVHQREFTLESRVVFPLGRGRSRVSVGPVARLTETDANTDRLIAETSPYGFGNFRQIGLTADIELDARDAAKAATRGAWLRIGGAVHPGFLDVESAFGEAEAIATAFMTPPVWPRPTLAVRAGGRKLWGDYPFADAAFIGDDATVRLGVKQRYAGDAAAWANAELRLKLARMKIVLPADIGVFGLYDTGRVWLSGEDSDRWHSGAGGGIWLAFLEPANTVSLAVSRAEGRIGVYLGAGFAY
jgi:hypothetical protein